MTAVFGASHLCIGWDLSQSGRTAPYSAGYECKFHECAVANPPEKMAFLRRRDALHDMEFHVRQDRLSLEFLQLAQARKPNCGYQPVVEVSQMCFDAIEAQADAGCDHVGALLQRPVKRMQSGGGSCFAVAGREEGGVVAMALGCEDVPSGLDFWHLGLGLGRDAEAAGGARLSLRALSPSWCATLALYPSPSPCADMYLDDEGPNCFSFFARQHESWTEKRLEHGARNHGEPFVVRVGGRSLRAVFMRGPNGELVELLDYS